MAIRLGYLSALLLNAALFAGSHSSEIPTLAASDPTQFEILLPSRSLEGASRPGLGLALFEVLADRDNSYREMVKRREALRLEILKQPLIGEADRQPLVFMLGISQPYLVKSGEVDLERRVGLLERDGTEVQPHMLRAAHNRAHTQLELELKALKGRLANSDSANRELLELQRTMLEKELTQLDRLVEQTPVFEKRGRWRRVALDESVEKVRLCLRGKVTVTIFETDPAKVERPRVQASTLEVTAEAPRSLVPVIEESLKERWTQRAHARAAELRDQLYTHLVDRLEELEAIDADRAIELAMRLYVELPDSSPELRQRVESKLMDYRHSR